MILMRVLAVAALAVAPLPFEGCAMFKGQDPLNVTVAGVEPLESQGMELRMAVKLRVQNPNDAAIDFSGVSVEMIVQGKTFATGVSDVGGSVPRFGETVITVPVTASAFRMLSEVLGLMHGGGGGGGGGGSGSGSGKISYEMKGKLNSSGFSSTHFQTKGELELPAS